MKLESTDLYEKSLQEVRKMPQDLETEKSKKKEASRELRMKVMLDNAVIMRDTIKLIEDNPRIDRDKLIEEISKNSRYLSQPVMVSKFINELLERKERVKRFIEDKDEETQAIDLFKQLSGDKKPKGKVVIKQYPFAMILKIYNQRDFELIDKIKNIGGYYISSHKTKKDGIEFYFPLIVENCSKGESSTIEEHEKGHSDHSSVKNTFRESGKKSFFLDFVDIGDEGIKRLEKYYESGGNKNGIKENNQLSEDWENIMNYILALAKNEILADFRANKSTSYHVNLKIKYGTYDYFRDIGLKKGSDLYNDFWDEYEKKIDKAIKTVEYLVFVYKEFELSERLDILRFVLMQIPMEKWFEQLDNSSFLDEKKLLYILYTEKNDATENFKKIKRIIQNNQMGSLIPTLKNLIGPEYKN